MLSLTTLFCFAFSLAFGGTANAVPLADFYIFGAGVGDSSLPPNDDGFSEPILLNMPFPFFGTRQSSLYVNNNGLLSFGMGIGQFTPQSFPLGDGRRVIAPFWGDVDTSGTGTVWYRETADTVLLSRARNEIRAAFVDQMSFEPSRLFIATWDHVGYYNSHTDLTNTFQCILITNGRRSFAIFNYADGEIQWTTGDASGGSGGFGGTPAQVGFNAGDGLRFANVPDSQTVEIVNITSTSNVDRPGVWMFRVDEEQIMVMQECSNDITVPLTIGPRFGNLLGGTAIHLIGPCFSTSNIIKCTFENRQEKDGIVLNNRTAICVSPTFKDAGWKSLDLIVLDSGAEVYSGSNRFYAVYPEDSYDLTIEQDNLFLVQNSEDTFTAHWDPQSLLPLLDPSSFVINIDLYRLDTNKEEWQYFLDVTRGHPNNGTVVFSVPKSGETEPEVYSIALRVSVGAREDGVAGEQEGISQFLEDVMDFVEDTVSQWRSDLIYAVSPLLFDRCLAWFNSEDPDIGQMLLSRVPDCCATEEKAAAPNSGFVRDDHDALVSFFHPGAASCYRQATITSENMESGQQCCYNSAGDLITGPLSGGTVDYVAPTGNFGYNIIRHFWLDVRPAIYCCKGAYKFNTCKSYYQRRPSGKGDSCDPPVPAFTFGDPHIVTLDGFKYTFNGLGEFVLIETTDGSFTLQGRMVQAKDENGVNISATAFSAIVARESGSDTVQLQLIESEIVIDELDALVNGELVDFEGLPNQQFNNVTLRKTDNSISAIFSSGLHIEAKVENGIISVLSVTLPLSYRSKTSGLMGNYDGNVSDDLMPKGQTEPISMSSTTQEIHNLFGITWIIAESEDSLFTYTEPESWSTYYQPNFVPSFEPVFSGPLLEQQANSICGGDAFCLYDIAATGRTEIGVATFQGNVELERIINISLPVVCDPPCENGVCVQNDSCSCSEGYTGAACSEAVIGECVENLCENGGTCTRVGSSSVCNCVDGMTGLLCQESSTTHSKTVHPIPFSLFSVILLIFFSTMLE